MKKYISAVILVVFSFVPMMADAQCVMCKAAAESSLVDGKSGLAFGINNGIFYLAAFPYIIIFTLIFLYLRRQKKLHGEELA